MPFGKGFLFSREVLTRVQSFKITFLGFLRVWVIYCGSAALEPRNWGISRPPLQAQITKRRVTILESGSYSFKVQGTILSCWYPSHATRFLCQRQGDFGSSTRVLLQVDHPLFSSKEVWRQSGVSTSSLSETLPESSKRYSGLLCSMLPIRLQMGMSLLIQVSSVSIKTIRIFITHRFCSYSLRGFGSVRFNVCVDLQG